MRYTRLAWSGLCVAALVAAFVWLPGWDTEVDEPESFSGAETFVAVLLVSGVVWLVGLSILAVLEDSLGSQTAAGATTAEWLMGVFLKTVLVLGLGFAGLLAGGSYGEAICVESPDLLGFECLYETLAGAAIGALLGVAAAVVVLLALRPRRRQRRGRARPRT